MCCLPRELATERIYKDKCCRLQHRIMCPRGLLDLLLQCYNLIFEQTQILQIKTYVSNLVRTTGFWNRLKIKYWKAK